MITYYHELTELEQRAIDAGLDAMFDALGVAQSAVSDALTYRAETAIMDVVLAVTRHSEAA